MKKIFTFTINNLYNICLKKGLNSKEEIIKKSFKSENIIKEHIKDFINQYNFIIDYDIKINGNIGTYTISTVINIEDFIKFFNISFDNKIIDIEFKNMIYKYFGKDTLHIFTNIPYYYYLYLKENITLEEYKILQQLYNELYIFIEKDDISLENLLQITILLLKNNIYPFNNILFLYKNKIIGYVFNNFVYYDITNIETQKEKDLINSIKNFLNLNINNIQFINNTLFIDTSSIYNNNIININLNITNNKENINFKLIS